MLAVIFEVYPESQHFQEYLDQATRLRPHLEKIQGFISVERFSSFSDKDKILSVSFWETEDSIREWKEHNLHKIAQLLGRTKLFKDYRIRVAEVFRDYSFHKND